MGSEKVNSRQGKVLNNMLIKRGNEQVVFGVLGRFFLWWKGEGAQDAQHAHDFYIVGYWLRVGDDVKGRIAVGMVREMEG